MTTVFLNSENRGGFCFIKKYFFEVKKLLHYRTTCHNLTVFKILREIR